MEWPTEPPHWLWWELQIAEQRALTAEAQVDRLEWAKLKAENRLERAAEKLRRRGYAVDARSSQGR